MWQLHQLLLALLVPVKIIPITTVTSLLYPDPSSHSHLLHLEEDARSDDIELELDIGIEPYNEKGPPEKAGLNR